MCITYTLEAKVSRVDEDSPPKQANSGLSVGSSLTLLGLALMSRDFAISDFHDAPIVRATEMVVELRVT